MTKEHWKAWPPDPYLIYGDFKIKEQTDSYIKMVGPESPISGVQLVKEVTVLDDGRVSFKVTAKNIRDKDVSWDLWSNTRVNGHAPSYAYVGKNRVRIKRESSRPVI